MKVLPGIKLLHFSLTLRDCSAFSLQGYSRSFDVSQIPIKSPTGSNFLYFTAKLGAGFSRKISMGIVRNQATKFIQL